MTMTIELDRSEYAPGDLVKATVRFDLGKPVKARGVFALLTCNEKHRVSYNRTISLDEAQEKRKLGLYVPADSVVQETRVEEHEHFREEKKLAGESNYMKNEFTVEFRLPQDARPTSREFGHDGRIVQWKLSAKVDIPWAPDAGASVDVFVSGL